LNRTRVAGFISTGDCLINSAIIGGLTGVFVPVAETACRKGVRFALAYLAVSVGFCLAILLTNRIIESTARKQGINHTLDFWRGFGSCVVVASIVPWFWVLIRVLLMAR
jgi:hypothetical protein